jgi:hypothetical protein
MMKRSYTAILAELGLLERLAAFHPRVIGTPPLGIDTTDSDIDVACDAADLDDFGTKCTMQFGQFDHFEILRRSIRSIETVLCRFRYEGWPIELFCQQVEIEKQYGVRHFHLEQRLLQLLGSGFRERILALRRAGTKTEAAFAQVLGLTGDPCEDLLELEQYPDQ